MDTLTAQPKTLMGFDYGTKRIGVAVGQTLTSTAQPVSILRVHQQIEWPQITQLVKNWQPQIFIVGLPYHADGSDNIITEQIRHFSHQLYTRYHLPVYNIEETLSTIAAAERLPQRYTKKEVLKDAVAAQIILETWMTEQLKNLFKVF